MSFWPKFKANLFQLANTPQSLASDFPELSEYNQLLQIMNFIAISLTAAIN